MNSRSIRLSLLLIACLMLLGGMALTAGRVFGTSASEAIAQTETEGMTVVRDIALQPAGGALQADGQGLSMNTSMYGLSGGTAISGRVSDSGGRGIAGIGVYARPASPGAAGMPAPVYTDAKGNYTIDISSAGYFKVRFLGGEADGSIWTGYWYGGAVSEVAAVPVPVGASGVDAVLEPTGVLKGSVEFPAKPFAVDIICYWADERQSVALGGTDPLTGQPGSFSFASLSPGKYKLLLVPDIPQGEAGKGDFGPFWYGGADWESAAVVVIDAGKTTEISVSIPLQNGVTMFGTLAYDSEAYSSAAVELVDKDGQKVVAQDSALAGAGFKNQSGYFQLNGVTPGSYRLRCLLPDGRVIWYVEGQGQGTEDISQATVISIEKANLAVGKIHFGAMSYPSRITGQVTRTDHSPVRNRRVYALRTTEGGERIVNSFFPITDGLGSFSGSLSPGTYSICTFDWRTAKQYCREQVVVDSHATAEISALMVPQDS